MVNSEEYISKPKRHYKLVDNTNLDKDWEFGTQLVPNKDKNLIYTRLDVKEVFNCVLIILEPKATLVSTLSTGEGDPKPIIVIIDGFNISNLTILVYQLLLVEDNTTIRTSKTTLLYLALNPIY